MHIHASRGRSALVSFCALVLLLLAGPLPTFASTSYQVLDLGTVPGTGAFGGGNAELKASGINLSGNVVGWGDAGVQVAFLYDGTSIKDVGTLGGSWSHAFGINTVGWITGDAQLSNNDSHAFVFDGSAMKDLGTLGGTNSWGRGINSSGQVAGWSDIPGGLYSHAFLYDGSSMKDLGTLGGTYSEATGINDAGHVTGGADTATAGHAFLYDGSSMKDLGTLGGINSHGNAIDAAGDVVGYAETSTGNTHAFFYDGSTMHDLGVIGGDNASIANGINSAGQIVGQSFVPSTAYRPGHAFIYSDGQMQDLNTLIPNSGIHLDAAMAINDVGDIIVDGTNAAGQDSAFLLTPTPEPSCLLLGIGAMMMLLGLRRTRLGTAN